MMKNSMHDDEQYMLNTIGSMVNSIMMNRKHDLKTGNMIHSLDIKICQ